MFRHNLYRSLVLDRLKQSILVPLDPVLALREGQTRPVVRTGNHPNRVSQHGASLREREQLAEDLPSFMVD